MENLEKEVNDLNKKIKIIKEDRERIMKEKQNLEKENKSLKSNLMRSTMQVEGMKNDKKIQKSNLLESQIFMDDDDKNPNSLSKTTPLNNTSLKDSYSPFGNFGNVGQMGQIKEENEDIVSNSESVKGSKNMFNIKNSELEFGSEYIDENEEETPKNDLKNKKKNDLKTSSIYDLEFQNNFK